MKRTDPLDESREWWVDGQLDQFKDEWISYMSDPELREYFYSVVSELAKRDWNRLRHGDSTLHQKGRLLKERCAREMDRCEDKIIQRDLRVDSEAG